MRSIRTTALSAVATTTLVASLTGVALAGTTSPAAAAPSPDLSITNVTASLQALQDIATANGGNRATGRPGYKASADWVKAKLDAAGFTTQLQSFSTSSGTSYNVIADWPGGDAEHVVMTGAHLDSVSAGPGINDNGTGSAAVLEAALAWAASGNTARNHLRFAWWGAEEQGLLGSNHYMRNLPTADKDRIDLYQNYDMVGSPNPGYFVYDDNAAGNEARDAMTAYYTSKGIPWEYIDVQGRSDHASFRSYGIATTGMYSGGEDIKTSAQAQKWGGTAGRAFDPCYHRSCDTTANINTTALDRNLDMIGHMVWLYADKDFGGTSVPPTGANLLANPGFESGAASWTGTSGAITSNTGRPAHAGTWKAWLGGNGRAATESVQQQVMIPASATAASLSYWLRTDTAETGSTAYDTLKVQVVSGGTTTTLRTVSNAGANATWAQTSHSLLAYRGRTITVKFLATEDSSVQTSFVLDDTSVTTS
ncbi:M28 family peptidase [Nocardioides oleivorans]|uniref:M28 family peptidase n=1 Tax=Nocardioides oleivorans TaxID=273676 RepID=A0A4Q2RYZ4_9ACTN|nr:M28 family metallopeptidase [Nocardioides oleivorans]RYB94407.1 M28 family peptidase [Nocardioides oleivorans]